MSDLAQIEADARKFAAQYSGFMKACEALGRIASLEQATAEAERRHDAAVAEDEAYRKKRDEEIEAKHRELSAEHAGVLVAMRKQVDGELAEARERAQRVIEQANTHAENLKQSAHDAAGRAAANERIALEHRETLEREIGVLKQQLAGQRDHLAALTADVSALAAKRDEILAHIEALRAKF